MQFYFFYSIFIQQYNSGEEFMADDEKNEESEYEKNEESGNDTPLPLVSYVILYIIHHVSAAVERASTPGQLTTIFPI